MTTTEISRTAINLATPNAASPYGTKPATDSQSHSDAQNRLAVGGTQTTPKAKQAVKARLHLPSGSQLADSQMRNETLGPVAVGANFTTGHVATDSQSLAAGGDQTSRDDHTHRDTHWASVVPTQTSTTRQNSLGAHRANASGGSNFPPDQPTSDHHVDVVGRDQTPSSQVDRETHDQTAAGPILRDPVLGVLADVLDDLESVRIANENRLRTLTATDEYGHGLTLAHPEIARLAAIVDVLKDQEHQAQLNLCRVMRKHPLWEFAKPLKGVGEKQFARLIAVIGDPYWNDLHDRPRTVSELRSYCGFGDAEAQRRQRGQRSNWNTTARSRVWLIAESCMKQKEAGQYRKVYDAARIKYADALHETECKRCGPAGKPAQPGSPLSLAHQHARGLRAIAKQLLKDLWLAAEAQRKEKAA